MLSIFNWMILNKFNITFWVIFLIYFLVFKMHTMTEIYLFPLKSILHYVREVAPSLYAIILKPSPIFLNNLLHNYEIYNWTLSLVKLIFVAILYLRSTTILCYLPKSTTKCQYCLNYKPFSQNFFYFITAQ